MANCCPNDDQSKNITTNGVEDYLSFSTTDDEQTVNSEVLMAGNDTTCSTAPNISDTQEQTDNPDSSSGPDIKSMHWQSKKTERDCVIKEACSKKPPENNAELNSSDLFSQENVNNDNDFIVIENPDYEHCSSIESSNIATSSSNVNHTTATSTSNVTRILLVDEILPPPRTLDDPPIRKPRGTYKPRGTNKQSGKKRSKRKQTVSENPSIARSSKRNRFKAEEVDVSRAPQEVPSENIVQNDLILPSMSASASDIEKQINILVEGMNDNTVGRPTSYEFRKKTQHVNYVDDEFLENSEDSKINQKKYRCTPCQLIFSEKADLKTHQRTSHSNKKYQCDQCERAFISELGLRRHTLIMHSHTKCQLCNKKFKIGTAFLNHIQVCGTEREGEADYEQAKPYYYCKECGRRFTERSNLYRHRKLHQGILKYTCEHCGKKCTEKQALKSHIRHIHSGERPYTCEKCSKAFTTKSDLNRHTNTVHSNVRRYMCPNCDKTFKTREALKAHLRTEAGERLWECGECKKRFVSKGGLKVHMVTHTEIKLYECETCQRQFTQKGSLQAHMKSHTGLMPHDCPVCGKKFAYLSNKNRHIRTAHSSFKIDI